MKIYYQNLNTHPLDVMHSHIRKNKIIRLYQDCRANILTKFSFVPAYRKGKIKQNILSVRHAGGRANLKCYKFFKAYYMYIIFKSIDISGVKIIIHAYNIRGVPKNVVQIWPMRKMVEALHKYTKPAYIRKIPI